MSIKTLSLLLTNLGREEMMRLLVDGKKPRLLLMLGSGYKPVDQADINLQQEEDEAKISLLFPVNEKNKKQLHIRATLSDSTKEYEIHEIGLFIEAEEKDQNKILFGIFSSEKALARKAVGIDLFLDIILDLQNYTADQFTVDSADFRPSFELPSASEKKLGIVQFATSEDIKKGKNGLSRALSTGYLADDKEIKNKTPGFILTTNNIPMLLDNENSEVGKWEKLPDIPMVMEENFTINSIIFNKGIYVEGDDCVYFLSAVEFPDTSELYYSKYVIADKKAVVHRLNEFERKGGRVDIPKNFHASDPCGELYYKKNVIKWSFSSIENQKIANFEMLVNFTDKTYSLKKFAFSLDGNLFYHNGKLSGLGGNEKASERISIESFLNEKGLLFPRKKPLVHRVRDKLYCLGGAADSGASLIEIINITSQEKEYIVSSFFPERTRITEELYDTATLTSCMLDSWIYIFDIKPIFYRYNTLDNQWQALVLTKEVEVYLENYREKIKKVFLVSVSKTIYLFFISENFVLSIFKFIPPRI
jgi:hypothetical protein